MGQDGVARRTPLAWRPGRISLRTRLTAVTAGFLAAGSAIIVVTGGLATRDHVTGQARHQLRSDAARLARHPFVLTPAFPGAPGPGGRSGLATAGMGPLSVEVRDSGGQLIMRTGPGGPGGSYLAIAQPIRYRAHHIPYAYGAEDVAVDVTSPAGTGSPGTLVVSLSLARIGQATGRLTTVLLALSGIVVLAAGCLAAWAIRAALRPITALPPALSAALPQPGQAGDPAGEAARQAAERQRQAVAGISRELRTPLSVLDGLADCYRRRDQVDPGDFERWLARVATETTRIGTLVDALERTGRDRGSGPDQGPGR